MTIVTKKLNFIPRPWQAECLQKRTRFSVWVLHRRAGKSTLAVATLCAAALKVPKTTYAYISPEKMQTKINVWDVFKEVLNELSTVEIESELASPTIKLNPQVVFREAALRIDFYNGSKIYLLGADNPDRIRGQKYHGVIMDEVAQMEREVWEACVRPALSDTMGWCVFLGTPCGINLFSEVYFKGLSGDPDWSSALYTVYQTNTLDPMEVASLKRELSDNAFRREFLCDFDTSASDQVISLGHARDAMHRKLTESEIRSNSYYPVVAGFDVAREGGDRSCIFFRRGFVAYNITIIQKCDAIELCTKALPVFEKEKPTRIFVDSTGYGGGVADILLRQGLPIIPVDFGSGAQDKKQYANKRAEMWFRMGAWLKNGGIIPKNEGLLQELSAPVYSTNESGRIILETKKEIKRRLDSSPDIADSLALTFAYDDTIPKQLTPDDVVLQDLKLDLRRQAQTSFGRFERRVLSNKYGSFQKFR